MFDAVTIHDADAPLTLYAGTSWTGELQLSGTSISEGGIDLSLEEERRLSKLLRDRAGIRRDLARKGA